MIEQIEMLSMQLDKYKAEKLDTSVQSLPKEKVFIIDFEAATLKVDNDKIETFADALDAFPMVVRNSIKIVIGQNIENVANLFFTLASYAKSNILDTVPPLRDRFKAIALFFCKVKNKMIFYLQKINGDFVEIGANIAENILKSVELVSALKEILDNFINFHAKNTAEN